MERIRITRRVDSAGRTFCDFSDGSGARFSMPVHDGGRNDQTTLEPVEKKQVLRSFAEFCEDVERKLAET